MTTERQARLLRQIQDAKADPNHDKAGLRKLVRMLVDEDDRTADLKRDAARFDSRGGSRSPAFGRWTLFSDDEY